MFQLQPVRFHEPKDVAGGDRVARPDVSVLCSRRFSIGVRTSTNYKAMRSSLSFDMLLI